MRKNSQRDYKKTPLSVTDLDVLIQTHLHIFIDGLEPLEVQVKLLTHPGSISVWRVDGLVDVPCDLVSKDLGTMSNINVHSHELSSP